MQEAILNMDTKTDNSQNQSSQWARSYRDGGTSRASPVQSFLNHNGVSGVIPKIFTPAVKIVNDATERSHTIKKNKL